MRYTYPWIYPRCGLSLISTHGYIHGYPYPRQPCKPKPWKWRHDAAGGGIADDGGFLPRDAMRKRRLCCLPLSVRPSVTLVHSIHTAEVIVRLLCRPGSPIILVFIDPAPVPNSKGNPFTGGTKCKGWENFAIFEQYRRLSRKRYDIGPWLLWNVNMKSCALHRMVTFSMTLTDP